jgi:Fe-S cluster assembly protein SufD
MMDAILQEGQVFLDQLSQLGPVDSRSEWMQELRQKAFAFVSEHGLPTTEAESWRYTDLKSLGSTAFDLPSEPKDFELPADRFFLEAAAGRLVFCNGHVNRSLSSLDGLPKGISVSPLSAALAEEPASLRTHISSMEERRQTFFDQLNLAFCSEGAVIEADDGIVLQHPIHLIFLNRADSEPYMIHPRVLIKAGRSSQLSLVEVHLGLGEGTYLTNSVTEIVAAENAAVDYCKLQMEAKNAYHMGTVDSFQDRSASVSSGIFTLSGRLVRNDSRSTLGGEGAYAELNGLYLASNDQHVDNYTTIEHAQPHCSSRELYKGILSDKARGVFRGRIVVAEGAQKTDSKQTNNNLLLSDDALVNTKPQLEIYADDVKCTHGATIGQVDKEALFYLRARGIDAATARSMLIYAFASEVVGQVKQPALKERLDRLLLDQLPGGLSKE